MPRDPDTRSGTGESRPLGFSKCMVVYTGTILHMCSPIAGVWGQQQQLQDCVVACTDIFLV